MASAASPPGGAAVAGGAPGSSPSSSAASSAAASAAAAIAAAAEGIEWLDEVGYSANVLSRPEVLKIAVQDPAGLWTHLHPVSAATYPALIRLHGGMLRAL